MRLLTAAIVVVVVVLGSASAAATGEPAPPDTVPTTANDFLPADQDLSDCISAVPQPNCGSESRGGWAQVAVFVGVGVALAFIGWRIVRGMRHRQRVDDEAAV